MSKVTLQTLQAMAKAAGINLNTATIPADASLLAMREKRADDAQRQCSELVKEANGLRNIVKTLQDENIQLRADRSVLEDTLVKAGELRVELQKQLTERLPEANRTEERERINRLELMLVESRSECDALNRTIAKLRPVSIPDNAFDRAMTGAPAYPSEAPKPPALLKLQFTGPQGIGTADRIKAIGGKWRFTSDKGSKIQGHWVLPDVQAAHDLLEALQNDGKACDFIS